MTARAGVDLDYPGPRRTNTLGVVERGLIAFDHRQRQRIAQVADCAFEQRGFAGTGRTHEIQGEDRASREPAPIAFGQQLVFRQNVLFQRDRSSVFTGMGVGGF
jgi:hypothetical protein